MNFKNKEQLSNRNKNHERAEKNYSREIVENRKGYHDKRNKSYKFELGDKVYVNETQIKQGLSKKLAPRWTGPFRIIKQLGPVNFEVQHLKTKKKIFVHANRLKPAVLGDGIYEKLVDAPVETEKELEKSHNQQQNKTSNETDDHYPFNQWEEYFVPSPSQLRSSPTHPETQARQEVTQPQREIVYGPSLPRYFLRSRGPVPDTSWIQPTPVRQRHSLNEIAQVNEINLDLPNYRREAKMNFRNADNSFIKLAMFVLFFVYLLLKI